MSSKLRILPLGGLGEIGKNMTAFEYEDEIIVVDAGIMFPENDMWGIDAIIPDYKYLTERKEKVRAVLLTHGHEDHVGALPHFLDDILVPIYATPLTAGLIDVKIRQAKLANQVQIRTIEAGDDFQIGPFRIEPFHVAHSIPDCVGFGIDTPAGLVVHTGDYKFDHTPTHGDPPDFAKLAEFSRRGVLCLLADSTNADRPGWTPSERVVAAAFDDVFRKASGRVIVATFASHISRIQQTADMAVKFGRKLAITGRSMRDNVKMAKRLGYLNMPDDLIIEIEQANKLPAREVAIMATGTQGEPSAVMGQLVRGRHRRFSIQPEDTVVFSAYAIPGNEEMVYRTINQLFRRGANVLYEKVANVHVSGHASQEEMKLMINLTRPQYLIPIHGELRHLRQHAALARQLDVPEDRIAIIENGTPIDMDVNGMAIANRLPGGYVFVEGTEVSDANWPVMREREKLANSGFFIVVVTHNSRGDLIGKPDIISRAFVDTNMATELFSGAEETISRLVKLYAGSKESFKEPLEEALSRYLYNETGKRPYVQVVVK